ncbi:MAG: ATP-binding protein [Promethearchaeota archaeon]
MTEAKQKLIKRKIIKIDEEKCTGCGQCVVACAEGALAIIEGKAKVINEVFCDGLGACIGECPEGALEIIERKAPEFDEEAVEKHLDLIRQKQKYTNNPMNNHAHICSCPSSAPIVYDQPYEEIEGSDHIHSALRQWPTKLTLVNPNAPYFNNEELLIVSDCSPLAYGDFHRKIMKGKPLVTVCPMLGLGELELNKIEEILRNKPIERVKAILMEVPCCQKLKIFLDPIVAKIERKIEVKETIISRDGTLI